MPIANRSIEPVFVSQVKVPETVENEFEYIVNATLSNFVKQLACLSLKANDIFGELTYALTNFVNRTETLELKIQDINFKIDCTNIDVIKPLVNEPLNVYRSHVIKDDELLCHTQMPECLRDMFNEAQSPPELFKLDEFRKNEEESMRFYTDPDFFLREWLKNARNERKKKTDKKKKRRSSSTRILKQASLVPTVNSIPETVEESISQTNNTDYNYDDATVFEDPVICNIYNDEHSFETETEMDHSLDIDNELINAISMLPPPPIFTIFPNSIIPTPMHASIEVPAPPSSVVNLLAEIKRGSHLRPVLARPAYVRKETKDFREFIKELRPAWDNQSDDED